MTIQEVLKKITEEFWQGPKKELEDLLAKAKRDSVAYIRATGERVEKALVHLESGEPWYLSSIMSCAWPK
ncbi:MAG: hypothetical protein FWC28_05305 [Proteobacteria bacterium]|nr:hypothetical protein [Cystobacterineae bacterium]MCL2258881.1 hypothetical protein [Cystobacterineae bacterium]MCL2314654.1 hypothetical protein [Pseudomonadota bacterium]